MKWISVKEKLPEEKTSLALWEPYYESWSPGYYKDNKFYSEDGYGDYGVAEPSHWMEIEPPKDEE